MLRNLGIFAGLVLGLGVSAFAQAPQQPTPPQPQQVVVRPDYILGPNDQILVRSNAEEINERPYRVGEDGFIVFPLIDRVQASGLTVTALEQLLIDRLRQFIVTPQVTITVTGFRNEPVSFFGAFRNPGVYPLTGGRTLIEMLTVVGGLQPNASRRLRITRRAEYGPIPLPNATIDPETQNSAVEIDIANLLQEINPIEDIELQAYDRITVEQAQPIFVTGSVQNSTPVELGARDSISVMQALTQAGGFGQFAKRKKIFVLRPVTGTTRLARIEVNVDRIMQGEENDFPLYANDILYVDQQHPLMQALPTALTSLMTSVPYALVYTLLLR